MNLLPFVMVIIMVLTLFNLSHFEEVLRQKKENQMYLAYFRGLREIRNQKVQAAYKKTSSKDKKDQKKSTKRPPNKKSHTYFREKRIGFEKGRLNLSSLLKKPHKYPSLEAVTVEYVKQLYGKAEFFPDHDEVIKDLVKTLIKKKEENPLLPLCEMTFDDPQLQGIFYKMMKGTQFYDLKGNGYPPFEDMFTFETSDRPPMNYHYANLAFLSLIFGQKEAREFAELEKSQLIGAKKKCCSPIKKPELERLLMNQYGSNPRLVLELFDFTYRPSERASMKYRDKETQITVKTTK